MTSPREYHRPLRPFIIQPLGVTVYANHAQAAVTTYHFTKFLSGIDVTDYLRREPSEDSHDSSTFDG